MKTAQRMFQYLRKNHGSYVEAEGKNLEKVELVAVAKGHELVKVFLDGDVKVGVLEIQGRSSDCL